MRLNTVSTRGSAPRKGNAEADLPQAAGTASNRERQMLRVTTEQVEMKTQQHPAETTVNKQTIGRRIQKMTKLQQAARRRVSRHKQNGMMALWRFGRSLRSLQSLMCSLALTYVTHQLVSGRIAPISSYQVPTAKPNSTLQLNARACSVVQQWSLTMTSPTPNMTAREAELDTTTSGQPKVTMDQLSVEAGEEPQLPQTVVPPARALLIGRSTDRHDERTLSHRSLREEERPHETDACYPTEAKDRTTQAASQRQGATP